MKTKIFGIVNVAVALMTFVLIPVLLVAAVTAKVLTH